MLCISWGLMKSIDLPLVTQKEGCTIEVQFQSFQNLSCVWSILKIVDVVSLSTFFGSISMQNGPLHAPLESLVITFAISLQQIWGLGVHNTIPFFMILTPLLGLTCELSNNFGIRHPSSLKFIYKNVMCKLPSKWKMWTMGTLQPYNLCTFH